MKTEIYIREGVYQLVFTPENKFEQEAIDKIEADRVNLKIRRGSFGKCLGGWVRQFESNDQSLILLVEKEGEK